MRNRIFAAAVMILALSATVSAQNSHQVKSTGVDGETVIYEISDKEGSKGDTLSVVTYSGQGVTARTFDSDNDATATTVTFDSDDWFQEFFEDEDFLGLSTIFGKHKLDITLILIIVLSIILMPVLILAIILIFVYKNRKVKYRTAEKLAASGQPIPENLKKYVPDRSLGDRGIHNMILGAGVTIILYAFTKSFALACIGLLMVLNGLSQYITSRRHEKDEAFHQETGDKDSCCTSEEAGMTEASVTEVRTEESQVPQESKESES